MQLKKYVQTLDDYRIYDTTKKEFKDKFSSKKYNISIDSFNNFVFIEKDGSKYITILTSDNITDLCSCNYLYLNGKGRVMNYDDLKMYKAIDLKGIYMKVGKDFKCIYED